MLEENIKILEKKGNLIQADSKNPLFLKDMEKVWIIKQGELNIFSVSLIDGKIDGGRNYLFTACEGEALFGLDFIFQNKEVTLVAVGKIYTEIIECSKEMVTELDKSLPLKKDFSQVLDKWINGLSSGVGKNEILPKNYKELVSGKDILIKEPASYRNSSHQALWVKQKKGDSYFMGRKDWFNIPKDEFFPIAFSSWIETEQESIFDVNSTQDILQNTSLWIALENFHRLIIKSIIANIESTDEVEKQRLKNRKVTDNIALQDTLLRIKTLLSEKLKSLSFKSQEKDKLLEAVRLVASSAGIKIQPLEDKEENSKVTLERIARNSRFKTRMVLLRGEWWKEDNGPLLAFREEDGRPVALIPKSAQEYKLYDSGKNSAEMVTSEAASSLKPFAYIFYRPFPDKVISLRDFVKFGFWNCGEDLKRVFTVGILSGLLALLLPFMTGIVFGNIIPQAELHQLAEIAFILLVSSVIIFIFQITRDFAILRIEGKVETHLQAALWDRLISLPVSFFRGYSSGELAKRGLGVLAIKGRVSVVLVNSIFAFIFSLFYFGLLFYYNMKLTFVVIGIFLLILVLFFFLLKKMIHYYREEVKLENQIAGLILQFLTGISKLRVFGTEDRALNLWSKLFTKKTELSLKKYGRIENLIIAAVSAFPAMILMMLFAWIIGKNINGFTVGHFVGFVTALTFFQTALLQLLLSLIMTVKVVPIYESTIPILQTIPEADETKTSPGELSGNIEVNGVYFRYNEGEPYILKNISLKIKSGEFVALVGSSGAGKSTLFRQLLGFETPASGTIYYDGQDLFALDIREVRQQMGVVLQNSKLIAGDILKNIIGASNLTIDDAWEAARMVGLEEDIKEMPMGMFTIVGPGGGALSGGQRQRILIARAIVKKPRILFFDEATSALDNKTQAIVAESIDKLKTTRIVIAHRLSTVIKADTIYVFQDGEIVQTGKYEELMKQEGLFAELAQRQLA